MDQGIYSNPSNDPDFMTKLRKRLAMGGQATTQQMAQNPVQQPWAAPVTLPDIYNRQSSMNIGIGLPGGGSNPNPGSSPPNYNIPTGGPGGSSGGGGNLSMTYGGPDPNSGGGYASSTWYPGTYTGGGGGGGYTYPVGGTGGDPYGYAQSTIRYGGPINGPYDWPDEYMPLGW